MEAIISRQGTGRLERRKLVKDQRGATMVEFALVAVPFFFLLFAVIELGLIFVANVSLSNATLSLARQIRVGKIMASGKATTNSAGTQMSLSDFKTNICEAMAVVPTATCLSQLQIDLRTQSSFQAQSSPGTGAGGNFNTANFCFYSGSPGDIVVMRAYFLWSIATPLLLAPLASTTSFTTANGTTNGSFFVLTSAEAFRNEPNATVSNTGPGC